MYFYSVPIKCFSVGAKKTGWNTNIKLQWLLLRIRILKNTINNKRKSENIISLTKI